MPDAAEPGGESPGAEAKAAQPAERALGGPPRGIRRSVLRVSQLLLRAITARGRLTLADLRRDLGHAGYAVRRGGGGAAGEAAGPEAAGTLLRVSGGDAEGCFRVCRVGRPRRRTARPRPEEAGGGPARPRSPRGRPARRKAAREAREEWRRGAGPRRARRGRPWREGDARRGPCARPRDEKRGEPEKPARRGPQKPPVGTPDGAPRGPRKARTKTALKPEDPGTAAETP